MKIRYTLSWQPLLESIAEDALRDGVFPLLTNCRDLSVKEVLEAYKRKQPLIEKHHEMLKTVLDATPVFLKNVACVEPFLFLKHVAMTVNALVERELRQATNSLHEGSDAEREQARRATANLVRVRT